MKLSGIAEMMKHEDKHVESVSEQGILKVKNESPTEAFKRIMTGTIEENCSSNEAIRLFEEGLG